MVDLRLFGRNNQQCLTKPKLSGQAKKLFTQKWTAGYGCGPGIFHSCACTRVKNDGRSNKFKLDGSISCKPKLTETDRRAITCPVNLTSLRGPRHTPQMNWKARTSCKQYQEHSHLHVWNIWNIRMTTWFDFDTPPRNFLICLWDLSPTFAPLTCLLMMFWGLAHFLLLRNVVVYGFG